MTATAHIDHFPLRNPLAALLFAAASLMAPTAGASANLALDKGCMTCHGSPPRGKTPSFAQVAIDYAQYQGQEEQIKRLARELCMHHMFGGVTAHERMDPADAEVFVRWLVDGGK